MILDSVEKTKKVKPRRVVLCGGPGIGKSTLAATCCPNPVFVPTEDGLSDIDTNAFPVCTSLEAATQPIIELARPDGTHGFGSVVIDSGDWLEKLIFAHVCAARGVSNISEIDYGRGYAEAAQIFARYLQYCDGCLRAGLNVVFIVHSAVQQFTPPTGDAYHRWVPKIHTNSKGEGSGALLFEWADEFLFLTRDTYSKQVQDGPGKNQVRNIGVGGEERIIYTEERPGWMAKNRFGLQAKIKFEEFGSLFVNQSTTNGKKVTK